MKAISASQSNPLSISQALQVSAVAVCSGSSGREARRLAAGHDGSRCAGQSQTVDCEWSWLW